MTFNNNKVFASDMNRKQKCELFITIVVGTCI